MPCIFRSAVRTAPVKYAPSEGAGVYWSKDADADVIADGGRKSLNVNFRAVPLAWTFGFSLSVKMYKIIDVEGKRKRRRT